MRGLRGLSLFVTVIVFDRVICSPSGSKTNGRVLSSKETRGLINEQPDVYGTDDLIMDGVDLYSELLSGNNPQAKVQELAKEEYDYEDYGNGEVPNLFPDPEIPDLYVFPAFPEPLVQQSNQKAVDSSVSNIVDDPSVNRLEIPVPEETDDNPMPPVGVIQNEEGSYGDTGEDNFFDAGAVSNKASGQKGALNVFPESDSIIAKPSDDGEGIVLNKN